MLWVRVGGGRERERVEGEVVRRLHWLRARELLLGYILREALCVYV